MSLLSPLSLILIIPLGGIIVFLYLLKLRRKEQMVSSTLLWQDAVADLQADAPFQKLKKNLLLFLQLLAVILLTMAIARPIVRAKGISENKIVVILDSSASMQSTDVKPSRFESAKVHAMEIANKMGPRDTMLVITASTKTQVVQSFTSDKKSLDSAVSALKPCDTSCNMRQALVLALSLVAGTGSAPPRIVIFSDGRFGSLHDLPVGKARLDFIKIGTGSDNVAITGIDSRKNLSGGQQVFIGIRNFSRQTRTFNLEIYIDNEKGKQGNLFDILEETLGPGEMKQEIIGNTSHLSGRITAKLDIPDDLGADNSGSVYLAKPRNMNVLLVSRGNIFLQNALNLDPRTSLTRAQSVPADFGRQSYDMVVFDGIKPPSKLPPGGYLLINTIADQGPAGARFGDHAPSSKGNSPRPTIIDADQHHPITRYVDFTSIRLAEANYLSAKPWARSIVEGESGPLAVVGTNNGRRFVQLGFDLLKSDFPLHVGFPIFISNCLEWLAPSQIGGSAGSRTGQPVYIDVPPGIDRIAITGPDGSKHYVDVSQTPVVFNDTDRAGIYRVTGKNFSREFACNLASPAESDTYPREAVDIGGRQLASSSKPVETNREYYWPLALIALAVMAFEWYAYHRRL
ncbi:MAG: VWA domain-containing protein [Armatimonadota bacterium]